MDEDPEALVERRLRRDPEDARELVLQRARPVGLDVRGREHQPVAAQRQERLAARARRAPRSPSRAGARRARCRAGSSSRRDVSKISRCSAVTAWSSARVDLGQRLGRRLSRGARSISAASLTQLEVAHDRVGDVEVGVEAHLAQAPADARDRLEHLVAQDPVRRVQALGRAEELLLAGLPLAADGGARLLDEGRRPAGRRRSRPGRDRRARAAAARASSRRAAAGASRRRARRACRAGTVSLSSASGIGSSVRRRAPGMRADWRPST